ncbi:hypothetical protein LBBP_03276 [Leptospira borgpetersenii serovar Ballum]|uniref:Uncharacterized protein n=1 Tax=Leptospira borgpetersenii serovar Ballum TaxID=280505 RepID=A0A0S2IV06_LEPBO|nr:hypothetical protein LBBP_03276 [Leptospira borgpetersenii serovar Ballum]
MGVSIKFSSDGCSQNGDFIFGFYKSSQSIQTFLVDYKL